MGSIFHLGKKMVYPGRFLILGKADSKLISVYGVTARSKSSKAKRYIFNPDRTSIEVEATDHGVMAQGDLNLLDYIAVTGITPEWSNLVIGNGRQVSRVTDFGHPTANEILDFNLKNETYEPDKYSTPRITGCTIKSPKGISQALHIVRNDGHGGTMRNSYEIDIEEGNFNFLPTYCGLNIRPTPFYAGDPIQIDPISGNAEEITRAVYDAFAPESDDEDLRVAVMTVVISKATPEIWVSIKNTNDI